MLKLNTPIIRYFKQHYVIKSAIGSIVSNNLQAEIFRNSSSTQNFIRHLIVPFNYWRRLLYNYNALPQYPLNDAEIINCVSELFIKQKLKLYPIKTQDDSAHPPQKRTIKTQDNVAYFFTDVSILLTSDPKEIKQFNTEKQAEAFLNTLKLDDKTLTTLTQELSIKTTNKIADTTSVNNNKLSAHIISALTSGNIIIIVDRYTHAPPKAKEILEDIPLWLKKPAQEAPPSEFKAITIDLEDEFEQNMNLHFSLFNGLEFTLKTDMGEEHKGTIENGKIYIAKAKIINSFKIKIKDMPAFMDA